MTGRELVTRAIKFQKPERHPVKFEVFGLSDCYDVWTKDTKGYSFQSGTEDEWGCVWAKTAQANTGQVVVHPLDTWDKLKDYPFPDPDDPRRYEGFVELLNGAEDKFVMFCCGHGLFERAHLLHGFQQTLEDMYLEPEYFEELVDAILDFHIRVIRNVHELGNGRIDAVALADDWGTETGSIISPATFEKYYKPRYAKLFKAIHDLGMLTWMHSCGRINDVLDHLIDAGLDVVNPQQPETVGIDEVARRFAGRICFESIVDTQHTYPKGSYEEIRSQTHELLSKWGTPDGGFIFSDYNDYKAIGTTMERRRVAFEAYCEFVGIDPNLYRQPGKGSAFGVLDRD